MISNKQKKILAFPYSRYDSLICDGAVRSGKTSIIMWSFIEWAMREFAAGTPRAPLHNAYHAGIYIGL